MGKTYTFGTGVKKTNKYVCIKDCESHGCGGYETYPYKVGEVFEYDYVKRKFHTAIYKNGLYYGSVHYKFIDKFFVLEEDYNLLAEVDAWYDYLLHSNVRITKIKKIEK